MGQHNHGAEPIQALMNSRLAIIISAVACLGAVAAFLMPNPAQEAELQRIAAEARRISAEQADVARIALAIAAAQLQTAVLEGATFEAEAKLVQRLGADKAAAADLAILVAAANSGVPSEQSLRASFDAAAAEATAGEGGGSWVAFWAFQTLDAIKSTATAIGLRNDATPQAPRLSPIVTKAGEALSKGDYKAVFAALDTLPPEARTRFDAWRKKAQSRLDAVAAANRIVERSAAGVARKS